jgi:hypothetical protein
MPCERIILHAGLHKSGTTSIQAAWREWLADDPEVDYPETPQGPGHPECAWGLMERRDADSDTLQRLVAAADGSAATMLVISSEEFDSLDEHAWLRAREELGADRTTLVVTITQPAHRWYATWQELVKHGHFGRPNDAPALVTDRALLHPGALQRLIDGAQMGSTVVRVVRPHPPESDLPRDLARAIDLPVAPGTDAPAVLNSGLGADTELLRRANAAGLTDGLVTAESIAAFARMRAADTRRPCIVTSDGFDLPDEVLDAARVEHDYLRAASADDRITLLDPHDCLPSWMDRAPSPWVDEIMASDWDTPDAPSDWSHRAAERILDLTHRAITAENCVASLEGSRAALQSELDQIAAAHATLAGDLQSMRASLSWRLTRPLRTAKGIARRA